jgi:hypothetical protein
MTFAAVAAPKGWAFDTITKFSPTSAAHLKSASWVGPLVALWRYVSLGAPSLGDITATERDAILGAGWLLGLVQHVEEPSWKADSNNGTLHGQAAVAHAQLVEYPVGCHIGLDMEGLGDAGSPVLDYVRKWAAVVHAAGYKVLMYVGYDDGLTQAQHETLASEGTVDAWWSDYGPRQLPDGQFWSVKQHSQTTVAGIGVDPDEILVDNRLVLMGLSQGQAFDGPDGTNSGDDQTNVDPTSPAAARPFPIPSWAIRDTRRPPKPKLRIASVHDAPERNVCAT